MRKKTFNDLTEGDIVLVFNHTIWEYSLEKIKHIIDRMDQSDEVRVITEDNKSSFIAKKTAEAQTVSDWIVWANADLGFNELWDTIYFEGSGPIVNYQRVFEKMESLKKLQEQYEVAINE